MIDLDAITGSGAHQERKADLLANLRKYAPDALAPHRMSQLLAQVMHESGGLRYVEEIWGPTEAQSRYEGRADLGNTQRGDGFKYRGRGLIQCTGRDNYRALSCWARRRVADAPDFEANPDAVLEHIGLAAAWYWSTRVPANAVDAGDLVAVTKAVNGGTNGLADRQRWYDRAALVLLGFGPTDVADFQRSTGTLAVDGVSGPKTRAAIHKALLALCVKPEAVTKEDQLRAALEQARAIINAALKGE